MKHLLLKTVFLFAVVSSTAFAFEFRRAKTLDDVYDASCRVSVSNARGSGVFIGIDEGTGSALILTNFHVVQNFKTATLEFWRDGVPIPIRSTITWRYYDASLPADFAILAIDADKLAEIDAPYVALGGPDCAPTPAAFFISAGCPKGSHVWSWKGVWRNVSRTAEFQPAPYPGQSGSGLFEFRDGELWYVGTLTWLVGDEGDDRAKGAAIPVSNIYRAIARRAYSTNFQDVKSAAPFKIPADYKEIAEIAEIATYRLFEYTRDACAACVEAEEDVRVLLNSGIYVDVINTSKGDGLTLAKRDGVEACPTFVLKDSAGKIVDRWIGAGYGAEIAEKIAKDFPNRKKEEEKKEKPKAVEKIELSLPELEPIPLTIEFEEEAPEDFRDRLPVRERYDGSFFDDAARLWADRNKSEKGEEEPARPKIFKEKGEEEPDDAKIGDKLAERIGSAIAGKIEPLAKELEGRIRSELETKELELKAEVAAKVRALVWKILGCFFVAFILAAFFYDFIKLAFFGFCKLLKKGAIKFVGKINELAEAEIWATYGSSEEPEEEEPEEPEEDAAIEVAPKKAATPKKKNGAKKK